MSIIETLIKIDRLTTDEKGVVRLDPINYAKIKKYILDNEFKTDLEEKLVKDLSEKEDKNDEIVLEDIGIFMGKIVSDVEEGDKEPLRGYLELKKIETGCKNFLKIIGDEAYLDFDNFTANDLPYGFTGRIINKIKINFTDDEIYSEIKIKLKDREDMLKNSVQAKEKGNNLYDNEGNLIEAPIFSYSSYLTVTQGKK